MTGLDMGQAHSSILEYLDIFLSSLATAAVCLTGKASASN